MLCKRPYTGAVVPVGCGQCMPCRINKRRVWTHRLMLEALMHESSTFITLTYNDEHLPSNLTLDPLHPKLWMKRLRRALPNKIRFYLVGEYGTEGTRGINPHYHAAIFGGYLADGPLIEKKWGMGNIHIGDLTPASAQYICGYVTKKLTNKNDPLLEGRYPEFSRQSNRPGIGATAMDVIGETLFNKHNVKQIEDTNDVPKSLQHGRKLLPLGQYLTQRLRNHVGMPDEYRQINTYLYSLEMSALLSDALSDPKNRTKSRSQIIADANAQKILQVEKRSAIYEQRKTL